MVPEFGRTDMAESITDQGDRNAETTSTNGSANGHAAAVIGGHDIIAEIAGHLDIYH